MALKISVTISTCSNFALLGTCGGIIKKYNMHFLFIHNCYSTFHSINTNKINQVKQRYPKSPRKNKNSCVSLSPKRRHWNYLLAIPSRTPSYPTKSLKIHVRPSTNVEISLIYVVNLIYHIRGKVKAFAATRHSATNWFGVTKRD